MKTADSIKTAALGLRHAKVRSLLTMLGIVIGISSVILLMSIGASAERLIIDQVESIGSNLAFIIPGAPPDSEFSAPPSAQGITIRTLKPVDADALVRDPSIERAAPEVRGQARAIFEGANKLTTFIGTSADYFEVRNYTFEKGHPFTHADVASFNRVAVIGPEIAETLFDERDPVGKSIRLKEMSFRVVGVLEATGVGPFGIDQDNLVIVPLTVAQKQLLGIDYLHSITVQTSDAYSIEFTEARITSILRQSHRITDPANDDFIIQTQEDVLDLLGNIISILTVFLTSIASISLVVGGIGIMNIMLVSVVERTREIGLRKAIGATNRDILQQFLWEAIMLTFIGGAAGIAIGAFAVTLLYFILVRFLPTGWFFALPLSAIGLAALVSTLTGLVFGLYPARQAARKNPIDALRYE